MNQTFFSTVYHEQAFDFSTRGDFLDWLRGQADFWQPVLESERAKLDPSIHNFFNVHRSYYESTSNSQIDEENARIRAQDYFNMLSSHGFPEAGTPAAELMREAALKLPPDVSRAMARSFAGEVIHPRSAASVYDIIGPVLASISRLPSLSALHPLRGSALEEQERIISSRSQQSQQEIRRALDEAGLATTHAQQFTADSREEFERRWKVQHTEATEQLAKAIDDFRTTEKTYKEHMKLRAPVHYWEEKKVSHNIKGWVTLACIVVFGLMGLDVLRRELLTIADQVVLPNPGPYGLFKGIALAILYSSIAFVTFRVALRIYMSERHLEIDAGERVAMIKTYLALTADDKVSDVERPLVLSPIFRPATDGIVRDDGSTAFPVEAIASKLIDTAKPTAVPR